MAPSTSGLGARSAPMASTAMMVGILACVANLEYCGAQTATMWGLWPYGIVPSPNAGLAGGLFDLDHLAPLVVAALKAGAMRHLALVTVGTFGQRLRRQMIVGAAL